MKVYVTALVLSVIFAYLYRVVSNRVEASKERGESVYIKKKKRRGVGSPFAVTMAVLSALPLTAVAAFRVGVGTDYYTGYVYSYYYNMAYNAGYYKTEPLYDLLESSVAFFKAPEIWIFIVSSVIVGALYYYCFFKYSINPEYSILMYFLTNIYFISLNAVRQGIAMSIIFLAIMVYNKGKTKVFLLLVLMAMGFHTSSVVFFLLPLLRKISFSVSSSLMMLLALAVGGGVIGRAARVVISLTRYAGYYNSMFDENEFDIFNTAIQLAILIMYSFYLERARQTEHKNMFEICYILQLMATFCIIQSATIPAIKRIVWHLSTNQFIGIPMVSLIEDSKLVKLIFNTAVIVLFAISIYKGDVVNGAHQILPYHSWFEYL